MAKKNFITFLLNPKNWWLPLLVIFTISIVGVTMIGVHTYSEAPPIPTYVNAKNEVVFSKEDVLNGQSIFLRYALMEYGSMFGDGANRGPDYTAEALHQVAEEMNIYYQSQIKSYTHSDLIKKGISEQVKTEIKNNTYNETVNKVTLSDGQAF